MKPNIVTEIVQFQTIPDVSEEEFIQLVAALEEHFHRPLPGYIDSELVKGKDRQWGILMHWESMESVKKASQLMMQTPSTAAFRQALEPTSVKIMLLEQIQTWRN